MTLIDQVLFNPFRGGRCQQDTVSVVAGRQKQAGFQSFQQWCRPLVVPQSSSEPELGVMHIGAECSRRRISQRFRADRSPVQPWRREEYRVHRGSGCIPDGRTVGWLIQSVGPEVIFSFEPVRAPAAWGVDGPVAAGGRPFSAAQATTAS